jgi:hypothetical protein
MLGGSVVKQLLELHGQPGRSGPWLSPAIPCGSIRGPQACRPQSRARGGRRSWIRFVSTCGRAWRPGSSCCSGTARAGSPGRVLDPEGLLQPLRLGRSVTATVRFETEPADQAQVDFGHFAYAKGTKPASRQALSTMS